MRPIERGRLLDRAARAVRRRRARARGARPGRRDRSGRSRKRCATRACDPHGPGVDAVAVTCGPGLVGSLLVGVSAAKAMAMAWGVPLVGREPPRGPPRRRPPRARRPWSCPSSRCSSRAGTPCSSPSASAGPVRAARRDDRRRGGRGLRQGRAVPRARLPRRARRSTASPRDGDPPAFAFPRPLRDAGYDVSLSGLKTAVVRAVDAAPTSATADVAASFQAAVVDVLVAKCARAVEPTWARARSRSAAAWRRTARCARAARVARGPTRRPLRAALARLLHGQRRDDRRGGVPPPRRRRPEPAVDARGPRRSPWRSRDAARRPTRPARTRSRSSRSGVAEADGVLGDADAIALATATPDGRPSVRMVLLRGITDVGVRFFTNYESRKGTELAPTRDAAIVWFDAAHRRQVRVEGTVAELAGGRVRRLLREPRPGPPARRGRVAPVRGAGGPHDARARLRGRRGAVRGPRRRAPRALGRVPAHGERRRAVAPARRPAARPVRLSARAERLGRRPPRALRLARARGGRRLRSRRRLRRDVSSQGALPSFPTGGDDLDALEGGGYATWLRRAGGFLIDSVVVLAVTRAARKGRRRPHGLQLDRCPRARRAPCAQPAAARCRPAERGGLRSSTPSCFLASPWQATLGMRACRVQRRSRVRRGPRRRSAHSAARAGDLHGGAGRLHAALHRRARLATSRTCAGRCGTPAARRSTTSSRGRSSSTASRGPDVGLRFPPSGFTDKTAARAGVRYASWLRRFGGWAIDTLLILTINYVIGALYSITIGSIGTGLVVTVILLGVISTTAIVYNTLCLAKLDGQTPGMRVLQIRCTPLGNRRRISIPQALTRSFVGAIFTSSFTAYWVRPFLAPPAEAVLGAFTLLAWFWLLVDQRRQTWWDHLAATVVLNDAGY